MRIAGKQFFEYYNSTTHFLSRLIYINAARLAFL